ncbi:MAG: hypothetical protein KF838_13155 [Phycisphaeraceae bacterium]|nr:MAG: hypothetical protein KF838_13155 [Phycisphaeraceae bacterium]
MPHFLVAIHRPDDYNPALAEDDAMRRAIDALSQEMVAAGIRALVGGLRPPRNAKSLHANPQGHVLLTDAPCLNTNRHVGGFWVLDVANMDEALA